MFISQNQRRKEEEPLTLSVNPTSINWVNGQSGNKKTITITTNGNWTVSQYSEALLTLNKTSGTGNGTIEISLKSTISATTSASITITATLGSQTQSATVNISLPVYTLNITGLVETDVLFDKNVEPVQNASRSFLVNTTWPSWTMTVISASNMGNNWRTWITFDKDNGTSSDNKVTYTMNNSYFKEGTMEVRFTGSDSHGNSKQYNYTWKISGITSIILYMKRSGNSYDAYIKDSYYTSLVKLDKARDYEKHGLFYPGSYLLEKDGPVVKLYDEYNIDCSPVYTVSRNQEEGLYYINFTPVTDMTTFNDPDLGGCGLRYIWVVSPGAGEWVDASVLSRIRLSWDSSGDSISYFSRDIVPESSMDKHYYNSGYEAEDTINPSGRGAIGMGWFQPYISSRSYARTWDIRADVDNFTKVIAFQSLTSGYTGNNLLLVEEWDGSTTSVQLSNADYIEIPDKYSGLKARWTSQSTALTASNFEYVSQRQ